MPQVVAAVAAFAGSTALAAGASAATAMVVANTVGWLMTYVVPTFLVSTISRAIQKRPTLPSLKALGMEVNVRDPAAPRSIIYGQRRVSGVLYPVGTSGTNNEYLHLLVLIAGHEVEELGTVYFNDEEVQLDGSGNATGKYAGYVRVKKHLGTYNQTVDTNLQTDLGSGTWSNNHKLAGIAYLYIRLKQSPDLFSGVPEFYCLVKGRKVYDPRDGTQVAGTYSTWKWSSNAALCLADWVRGVPSLNGSGTLVRNYGVGASDAEMDYTALTTAANICDETVALSTSLTKTCDVASGNRHIGCANVSSIVPGLKVTGTGIPTGTTVVSVDDSGTFFTVDRDPTATNNGVTLTIGSSESRYQAHGTLASSVRAGDGIDALKSAMAGDCVYVGGQWLILAGAYRTPTVTLTESDLRASLTGVRLKPTRREIVNVVKGVFVSPANAWQPSDFPPVRNATYKTQDGGEDLPADIELPFTTSSSCAQRLAKIMLERSRQGIAFTAKCKLTAMQVQVGDVVRFTNVRFGWSAKPFEVLGFSFNAENDPSGAPYLGVDLTLKETASGVWDWNSGEETTIDLAPNTNLPTEFTVAAPGAPTFSTETSYVAADGTAYARVNVLMPAMPSGGSVLYLLFRMSGASEWMTAAQLSSGSVTVSVEQLAPGITYDFAAQAVSGFGVLSTVSTVLTRMAPKNTAAPAAPTGLVASVGTGKAVSLDWDDNTEPDLSEYAVYRNTTGTTPANANTDKIAEVRASRFVDTDVTLGTTYYYWVAAYDTLENVSGFSSRVTAVPAFVPGTAVDSTAPATPNAPTFSSESTYLTSDGAALARVTITAPAMPTGGAILTIMYRRSGASDWIVGNQIDTGSISVSIDDLSPGVAYEFAARAISRFDILSAVSSTLSRTAPTKSSAPGAPTSIAASKEGVAPNYLSTSGVLRYGSRVTWSAPTDKDVAYYEIKATQNDTDGDTVYQWDDGRGSPALYRTTALAFTFYSTSLVAGYVRVRAIDRSGNASAWLRYGNINDGAVATRAAGNLSQQNKDAVEVTGIKTGNASSVRQINVIFTDSVVATLAGGATTESFNVSLSNRGFSAKPDFGVAQCASNANLKADYDYDAAGNDSNNAVVRVTTLDGTNIPNGLARFSVEFKDYT